MICLDSVQVSKRKQLRMNLVMYTKPAMCTRNCAGLVHVTRLILSCLRIAHLHTIHALIHTAAASVEEWNSAAKNLNNMHPLLGTSTCIAWTVIKQLQQPCL